MSDKKLDELCLHIEDEYQMRQREIADALGVTKGLYGNWRHRRSEWPVWRIMQAKALFKIKDETIWSYLKTRYTAELIAAYAAQYKRTPKKRLVSRRQMRG